MSNGFTMDIHEHEQGYSDKNYDPSGAVRREPATRDDAVQVGMMEVLAPQHGEEADLGAQVLGNGGDAAQRLGGGAEEKP